MIVQFNPITFQPPPSGVGYSRHPQFVLTGGQDDDNPPVPPLPPMGFTFLSGTNVLFFNGVEANFIL